MSSRFVIAFIIFSFLAIVACSNAELDLQTCRLDTDCSGGNACIDGMCQSISNRTDGDGEEDTENNEQSEQEDDRDLPDLDGDVDLPADGDNMESDLDSDGDQVPADIDPVETDGDLDPETDSEPIIPPGNTCDTPIQLIVGHPLTATTLGATNDLEPPDSCSNQPMVGPDVIFAVDLLETQSVKISVLPTEESFNPAVYILPDCDSSNLQCLDFTNNSGIGSQESIHYTASNTGTLFIVVDSPHPPGVNGAAGEFIIAVLPDPPLDTCQPCGDDQINSCGGGAECVQILGANGRVEAACSTLCGADNDCPTAFKCGTRPRLDNTPANVCVPKYEENGKHVFATCGALSDMGTPCLWNAVRDDDAQCGADENGQIVDDAVCQIFFELTSVVSYCTIYCIDDSECPEGYFCYDVPLSNDFVCKLR